MSVGGIGRKENEFTPGVTIRQLVVETLLWRYLHLQASGSELSIRHHMPMETRESTILVDEWEIDGLNAESFPNCSSHKRDQMVVLNESRVCFFLLFDFK